MPVSLPYLQSVSINGDGTGGNNMNGNYSVTPQLFRIQPPAATQFLVYQLRFLIADNAALNLSDYGAIGGGLTNGVQIEAKVNGVISDRLQGMRIKQNWQWFGIGNGEITLFSGTPQMLVVEAFFPEFYGEPLTLNGNSGDYFGFRMADDLTGLVGHMCWVRSTAVF